MSFEAKVCGTLRRALSLSAVGALLAGCIATEVAVDDAASKVEEYRHAGTVAETRWTAVDEEPRQALEEALADFDRAVASENAEHPAYARARATWEKLADQEEPAAIYHLGILHLFGLGGAGFDQIVAMSLIRDAARKGYPPAQSYMGLLAEKGDGTAVLVDDGLALEWYTHGARGGHCAAVRRLVKVYSEGGLGVRADEAAASAWRAKLDECRKR